MFRRKGYFNPRAPHGARLKSLKQIGTRGNFNPRAPHGARLHAYTKSQQAAQFQSTRPSRGATIRNAGVHRSDRRFQSTRPSRGATRLRASYNLLERVFQSTRPSRGATVHGRASWGWYRHFNPRAPHGARPGRMSGSRVLPEQFQSTRPSRGATHAEAKCRVYRGISIHAPLTGRDPPALRRGCWRWYFNPRAPHGARQDMSLAGKRAGIFQSTRPSWGATFLALSSGALVVFQSTRPSRGATADVMPVVAPRPFQSTRPSRGATRAGRTPEKQKRVFQSTRPSRGAT